MNGKKFFQIIAALLILLLLQARVRKTEGAISGTTTRRVSVASDGTQANSSSYLMSISANGRYIAFASYATNLVGADGNGYLGDVFVHDMQTGQTTRVSVASDGTQGNGESDRPSISADGRFVAFHSGATNLVPGDTNGKYDVFVHDMQTGQTVRVSVASDGTEVNDHSFDPDISANGRYIVFTSYATNLVTGDTNGGYDVFVRDMQTGQTTRVSVASDGTQSNGSSGGERSTAISADGRYIAFESTASNLVVGDTFRCPGYVPSCPDVFVHDMVTGQTTRVSVASDGTQGNGETHGSVISSDGRYVAFTSSASNLVLGDTNSRYDVFVHDMQTGQTTRVSVASDGTEANNNSGGGLSMSSDGRYVAFNNVATNLVTGDTNGKADVFVHDMVTGQTIRASVTSDGTQGNGDSGAPSLSSNGRYLAFSSVATNLVINDTNAEWDIFLRDQGGVSYPVSGRVTDGTNAISGVTINWTGGSAITDANGYYVTNVVTGTYTLTASKNGYTFSPISRDIVVPPSKTGQDFVGSLVQQGCSVPFLSQRDDRWKDYPLRTTGSCSISCNSIGACGCTLTAANMVFNYYGAALAPLTLSDCMGTNACPFSWTAGAACTSGKASWINKSPFSWNQLDLEVNQNKRPVVLGMHKKTDSNQTHWVTVVSGQGSSPSGYTMHDPWFLGGANTSLTTRSKDYDFDWISSYSGQPSCPASPLRYVAKSASTKKRSAAPSTVVTGNVWIYGATDTTMTLFMVAKSDVANVIEMQIWTDVMPSAWQPFASLITVPLGNPIQARFRDELGNVSDIYTDSIYPVNSPPRELFKIFLPIIVK